MEQGTIRAVILLTLAGAPLAARSLDSVAARRRRLRLPISRLGIDDRALVFVVMAYPRHGEVQSVLVAALGGDVEEVVRADENIEAAAIARIGVENVAGRAPAERAGAGPLLAGEFLLLIIIHCDPGGFLLRRRRHVIVEVEIAAEGRHPFEMPSHAALEFLDLPERRPGDDDEGDVTLRDVNGRTVEMIGEQRTARAAFLPVGSEHEVVDDELALRAEKAAQRFLAAGTVEN